MKEEELAEIDQYSHHKGCLSDATVLLNEVIL